MIRATHDECFLVTGALGCIGAWTVRTLVREGVQVVGLDLSDDPHRLRLIMEPDEFASVPLVRADITERDQLAQVLDEHEVTNVIHLAALQLPFCKADPSLGARVNVVGTVNIFETAKERLGQVQGVVYASSVAVYGTADDYRGQTPPEDAPPLPHSLYGVYKVANEGTARVFWEDDGVPSIGLRPYTVYGPGRDQGMTSTPTKAMLAAAQGRSYRISFGGRCLFAYAPDVAQAFILASRACTSGAAICNVPGTLAHMRDIVAAIEAAAPEVVGKITFEELSLPFPEEFECRSLAALVGPVPVTPLAQGVGQTVKLFRRVGALARS